MKRAAIVAITLAAACRPQPPEANTAAGDAAPGAAVPTATATAPGAPAVTANDTTRRTARDTLVATAAVQPFIGYRGKVVSGGTANAPVVSLQLQDGSTMLIKGGLQSELNALAGAVVNVKGMVMVGATPAALAAEGYDVVEIDGKRPFVGRLLPGPRLVVEADTFAVKGALDAPAGAKVWITGQRSGQTIQLQSFGIIRRD